MIRDVASDVLARIIRGVLRGPRLPLPATVQERVVRRMLDALEARGRLARYPIAARTSP